MNHDSVRLCDGYENMDFARVTQMLSRAGWSPGIGEKEVKQGARYSALLRGQQITD
ncbi:MAG TPA: hypothetical protein PKY19_04890 [Oscillospiraceae bacterium]|nr:hypothetical protein [Oscillospiraceae bacterium]